MKHIYTTTPRLNLADEDDRRAYEHLQMNNIRNRAAEIINTEIIYT